MSLDAAILKQQMHKAVKHCTQHVLAGGLPFVGVVLDDAGFACDYGVNRVRETGDRTAHAEIQAMRQVLAAHGDGSLRDMTLLATGEPCALCYQFARDQGIGHVYFAVGRDTAAAHGFDYRAGYAALGVDDALLAGWAEPLAVANGLEPFTAYQHRLPEA